MTVTPTMSSGEEPTDGKRSDGEVTHVNDERAFDRRSTLEGTVVRYDDRPDACTIHPSDPTERERTTTWITARGEDYVSAIAWR